MGGGLALLADGLLDIQQVLVDAVAVGVEGLRVELDGPQDLASLVVAVVGDEPTRGLGEEHDGEEGHDGEEDLEGKREAELRLVGHETHAVVGPVAEGDAEDVDRELDGQTLSTALGLHELGVPDGWDLLVIGSRGGR